MNPLGNPWGNLGKPYRSHYISNFDTIQAASPELQYDECRMKSHGRELYYGLIRMHVLLHARQEPVFGLAMMEELGHHGYRIGPGTLYPLLHGLERSGLLKSFLDNVGGRRRRLYKITAAGKKALEQAAVKVDELHHELHEAHPRRISSPRKPGA